MYAFFSASDQSPASSALFTLLLIRKVSSRNISTGPSSAIEAGSASELMKDLFLLNASITRE